MRAEVSPMTISLRGGFWHGRTLSFHANDRIPCWFVTDDAVLDGETGEMCRGIYELELTQRAGGWTDSVYQLVRMAPAALLEQEGLMLRLSSDNSQKHLD